MKFNWVTFKVKDLQKSLSFYNGLLGINIAEQFGDPNHQIVMLGELDAPKIELIFDTSHGEINPGTGVSVGLEIAELDKLIELLNENGYAVSDPVSPNPELVFYFVNDPDGYTIQLIKG